MILAMSYSAEISRNNPALIGFLIDQSSSMNELMMGGAGEKKSKVCADLLNAFLSRLIMRNIDGDTIKNRFEIFAIGYGGADQTRSMFEKIDKSDMPINLEKLQECADLEKREQKKMVRVPDGVGGAIVKEVTINVTKSIWVKPEGDGVTPMGLAFRDAFKITNMWIEQHRNSYPPIIIHITDGEWTDEDPAPIAEELKNLKTSDGNVLVFNASIAASTSNESVTVPIEFPGNEFVPPSEEADLLFKMSSRLTDSMISLGKARDKKLNSTARGFTYNADFANLLDFLDIGTRPAESTSKFDNALDEAIGHLTDDSQ